MHSRCYADTGKTTRKTSLLLASGYWGTARHLHYLFELMAAYSWCLLANPMRNGALPMLYCSFLTVLLMHRAKRDEEKCLAKYGKDFTKYMQLEACPSYLEPMSNVLTSSDYEARTK